MSPQKTNTGNFVNNITSWDTPLDNQVASFTYGRLMPDAGDVPLIHLLLVVGDTNNAAFYHFKQIN